MANYQYNSVPSNCKIFFKAVMLCALIHITYGTTNFSATLPVHVLNELVDISENSKGLNSLWKVSSFLKDDRLLKDKVRVVFAHACSYNTIMLYHYCMCCWMYGILVILAIFHNSTHKRCPKHAKCSMMYQATHVVGKLTVTVLL